MSQEVIEVIEREIEVVQIIERGPQGQMGPIGPAGPVGTTDYNDLENVPSTFPPSAHSHVAADIIDFNTAASTAAPIQSVTGTAPIISSGGSTPAISISAATQSADGSMSSADKTKLDGIATGANNYTHPNHSGDVTSVGDGVITITNGAVTNTKLASVAASTIKGRVSAGTGSPEDLSASQVRTLLNVEDGAQVNTVTSVNGQTGTVVIDRVENIIKNVRNTSGSTLPIGTAVRVVGATGENPNVQISNATSLGVPDRFNGDKNIVFGITTQSINNNAVGEILLKGTVKGVNTTAYNVGDFLFVPATGTTLVTVPPAKPAYQICVGLVVKKAADGEICINVVEPIHANDITGFNLDRATLANKQAIIYNGSTFVNSLISYADLTNTPSSFTPSAHASSHTNGTDDIQNATASQKGLATATQIAKLDGIAANANNYSHPNHTGDVTSVGDGATTIANDAVTNAKLANMATSTIKGRITASTGDPEDLSASEVRTIINVADGAEVNVQSNWTETDSGSDAFILNKPTLGTAAAANTTDFAAASHTHTANQITDFNTAAAAAAPVQSVAGRTGTVTLAKADVGLSNVDNTSDLSKPISTAAQTALDGKAALSHTHTASQVTDFNTAAAAAAPVQSVAGRTGTITLAVADVSGAVADTDPRLTDARTPTSHTHGNITNDGKIGSTTGLPIKTGTDGVLEAGAFGTTAGSFCEGNDARLSDSRDPNPHTHELDSLSATGISAGKVLSADGSNGAEWVDAATPPIFKLKSTTTAYNSSDLVADPHLFFEAEANKNYAVTLFFIIPSTPISGDIDAQITQTGTAQILGSWTESSETTAFKPTGEVVTDRALIFLSDSNNSSWTQNFVVVNGGTDNVISLNFASSDGARIGFGSYLRAEIIPPEPPLSILFDDGVDSGSIIYDDGDDSGVLILA